MCKIKSFTIYEEYIDLISILPDEEGAMLLKKIIDYVFYNIEPTNLSSSQLKIWRNLKRPIDISKKRSLIGSRGAEIKKANDKAKHEANDKAKHEANDKAQSKMSMSMLNVNIKEKDNRGTGEEEKTNINEEFNSLWHIYPNKKGKAVAMQKYSLARKQGATYEEVRQGLEHYIKYCETIDKKFIKHGSTWFNQKCWMDEYGEIQNIPGWFYNEPQIERSELSDEDRRFIEEIEGRN